MAGAWQASGTLSSPAGTSAGGASPEGLGLGVVLGLGLGLPLGPGSAVLLPLPPLSLSPTARPMMRASATTAPPPNTQAFFLVDHPLQGASGVFAVVSPQALRGQHQAQRRWLPGEATLLHRGGCWAARGATHLVWGLAPAPGGDEMPSSPLFRVSSSSHLQRQARAGCSGAAALAQRPAWRRQRGAVPGNGRRPRLPQGCGSPEAELIPQRAPDILRPAHSSRDLFSLVSREGPPIPLLRLRRWCVHPLSCLHAHGMRQVHVKFGLQSRDSQHPSHNPAAWPWPTGQYTATHHAVAPPVRDAAGGGSGLALANCEGRPPKKPRPVLEKRWREYMLSSRKRKTLCAKPKLYPVTS